jgi:hypothetical protein
VTEPGPTGGERGREGLDHLQAAALEAISAARAFLDVAEELVREPGAVSEALRAVAAAAAASARAAETGGRGNADPGAPDGGGDPGHGADPAGGGVRRIPLR